MVTTCSKSCGMSWLWHPSVRAALGVPLLDAVSSVEGVTADEGETEPHSPRFKDPFLEACVRTHASITTFVLDGRAPGGWNMTAASSSSADVADPAVSVAESLLYAIRNCAAFASRASNDCAEGGMLLLHKVRFYTVFYRLRVITSFAPPHSIAASVHS